MLLSRAPENKARTSLAAEQVFECKSCNRKLSSFQALGDHRASQKRPKLEAGNRLKLHPKPLNLRINKPKMYPCSICGLEFSLGQALGGHTRKHRVPIIEEGFQPMNQLVAEIPVLKRSNSARLDLNLTPLENDLNLLFAKMASKVHLSLL
ncbi:hypothetical protein L6164_009877 [Bauhinia variegata]|uniref:Uncharacterized protein n=1 Tax=Bauhinia variegata TaxID=167791 RepID=A0ACB9PL77_BAUVA|nr:hypothetical protein L6164_009877 [Bauhinia variegata]